MKLVVFGGDGRDRGGKPLAFASQIPDYMSLVLACGERTRWTNGSIPCLIHIIKTTEKRNFFVPLLLVETVGIEPMTS